jgi:anti-sigma factor RsiW
MANRKDNTKKTACSEWEMQLADALDGELTPEKQLSFHAHKTTCAACAELFEEARRGREWLGFLAEEPEVPEGLLERILSQTGPAASPFMAMIPAVAGAVIQMPPVWQHPGYMARASRFVGRHFEPRLLMTAAMAFFSIALTLNLSGFRLDRIHMGWISPNVIRSIMERRVTSASSPIVRYYDHVRDSYEVESKVRAIEKTTEGFAVPPKNQNDEPQATPQNEETPNSAPTNSVTPHDDSTLPAHPNENVTPDSGTPQGDQQKQADPQKQAEPKTPGRQGAQIEPPESRMKNEPAGVVNRTRDTNSTHQDTNSTHQPNNIELENFGSQGI